jgi:putative oxidoreductase
LIGHRFWEITDAGQRSNQLIHFWKNMAMIGGFIALYAAGGGAFSVDARRRPEVRRGRGA